MAFSSWRDLIYYRVEELVVSGPTACEMDEELPVAGGTGQVRGSGPGESKIQFLSSLDHTPYGAPPQGGVTHHTTGSDRLPPDLELGLDQQHEVTIFYDHRS
jgi:hypothetical protein